MRSRRVCTEMRMTELPPIAPAHHSSPHQQQIKKKIERGYIIFGMIGGLVMRTRAYRDQYIGAHMGKTHPK